MKLSVEWGRSLQLNDSSHQNSIYSLDINKIPEECGIYIFGREHGKNFEALYVGKAKNLRKRVNSQLKNNIKVMMHLYNSKAGKRVLRYGEFVSKPGQQKDKCIAIIERAMIRHFLSEAHDLVNLQGTRLRQHEIECYGFKQVPSLMFVDEK